MEWQLKALGNSEGICTILGKEIRIPAGNRQTVPLQDFEIYAENGKFADSEDSFIFFYTAIDPSKNNFRLSASFVLDPWGRTDQQTGYGIMAADTVESLDKWCRHRNYLLVGQSGRDHSCGLRAVAGYSDSAAKESGTMRRLDQSRLFFPEGENGGVHFGEKQTFSLEKTDNGFIASFQNKEIRFPGCSFLMKQESQNLYVGIACARKIRLQITDIQFELSDGKMSHTPEDAIVHQVAEYPFSLGFWKQICQSEKDRLAAYKEVTNKERVPGTASSNFKHYRETTIVSPKGTPSGAGTHESPLDLQTALNAAFPGSRILLEDGLYEPDESYAVIPDRKGSPEKPIRLEAIHRGKAFLDGSRLKGSPLFILAGNCWHLLGLSFAHSPVSGLIVCGHGNVVENCITSDNGDTGLLIISLPGAERKEWPGNNTIIGCISHDNCDPVCCNADGFGAKLRIGKGNSFTRCIAYHNIDDGFDLYTKSIWGPTEPVELNYCIAFENGFLTKTMERDPETKKTILDSRQGIGFKLGGENQSVAHELWACIAFRNRQAGFSVNSNPACKLYSCYSSENGVNGKNNYKFNTDKQPHWIREKLACTIPNDWVDRIKHGVESGEIWDFQWPEMQRKHILMLITSLGGGGAERVTCRLASELSRRHDVTVYTFSHKETEYQINPAVHVETRSLLHYRRSRNIVSRAFFYFCRHFDGYRRILHILRRCKPDSIISMMGAPNLMNALLPGRSRRIMSERNDPSHKTERYRKYELSSFHRADHVVFQSERVRNQFPAAIREKGSIIPNPVEVSCYAVPSRKKKIVNVGRLHPQKNQKMLLRAFARFHCSHPEYQLYIYGDGELKEKLEALINELNLQEAAHLEGFCENICEEIQDAEMFVLSSDYEGMSNALMEAMMMGIACISTNCAGSEEILVHEQNSLVVPAGDEEALARAMIKMSEDPALRKYLEEKAKIEAMRFRPEEVVRKWERIL